jgi:hypothetical protein
VRPRLRNDRTLRQRLDELIENSGEPVASLLANYNVFSKRVVQTRNSLAHEGTIGTAFAYDELFWAQKTLEHVFRSALLRRLSFSDEQILRQVLRTTEWRWMTSARIDWRIGGSTRPRKFRNLSPPTPPAPTRPGPAPRAPAPVGPAAAPRPARPARPARGFRGRRGLAPLPSPPCDVRTQGETPAAGDETRAGHREPGRTAHRGPRGPGASDQRGGVRAVGDPAPYRTTGRPSGVPDVEYPGASTEPGITVPRGIRL